MASWGVPLQIKALDELGMWHPDKFALDDWRPELMAQDEPPAPPSEQHLQRLSAPGWPLAQGLLLVALGATMGAAGVILAT